jgi:hypothetical protein
MVAILTACAENENPSFYVLLAQKKGSLPLIRAAPVLAVIDISAS